ncbi:EAL domain-containing protein [Ferrimonas balearica]|uniref:EAL domain-containing protein n=1 Tax=Ferrimonas balearica TaxID=44012 RepID=UPI001C999523|nr:EAL domain-containing protein [Ferrimonas balearica]MBY5993392.1 EAL domain-containing protein [Ferrimonas balearica]
MKTPLHLAHRLRERWPLPRWSLLLVLGLALLLYLASLVVVDFVLGRDMMRGHLQDAQQHLLKQRAQQLEQLMVTAGVSRTAEVAEQIMLQWAQEDSLLAAAIVDRDQRIYFGSQLIWRGGQATQLLDGYRDDLARKALLGGRAQIQRDSQRGSLQIYYPLAQLKPQLVPRLLYLEQDLTPLNRVTQQQFTDRLSWLWLVALLLAAGLVALGYRYVVAPLRHLSRQVMRLGEPELTLPPASAIAELGTLGERIEQSNQRLRQSYAQLVASEQRWLYAVEGLKVGVWDWQLDSNQVFFSHHWKSMLGYRDDELVASFDAWEQRLHPEDRARVLSQLQDYLEGNLPQFENLHRLCHRDGHYIWVLDRAMMVDWNPDGSPRRLIGTHTDVTNDQGQPQLGLSGDTHASGLNRPALLRRLEPVVQTPQEDERAALLLYLDLDDFKVVNDVHGHHCGDRLMEQVEMRLQKLVPEASLVLRLEGDEFVVVVTGLDPQARPLPEQALSLGQKIHQGMRRPWILEGRPLHVGASIGITQFHPGPGQHPNDVVAQAELAVFDAKERERGTTRLYRAELHQEARRLLWLRDGFYQAMEQNQLSFHYQPVMDGQREILSVEGLLRWHHPERGELNPKEFLPVVARYGLSDALAERQLALACRDMASLRRHGLDRMSLNVTLRQLQGQHFLAQLKAELERHGIPAGGLALELSTEELDALTPEALAQLGRLRELGVPLVLDRFGGGPGALTALAKLAPSEIKLDCRHLWGLEREAARRLLLAQIQLVQALGLPWTAEGVDEEGWQELLLSQGAERFQGYLFSAPRPLPSLLNLLSGQPHDDQTTPALSE